MYQRDTKHEAEETKLRRIQWVALGICNRCGQYAAKEGIKHCERCNERTKRYNQNTRGAIKLAVFDAYGGCICKCCGETHPMLLTIDHIANNGASHRASIFGARQGKGTGGNMYTWLRARKYPEGYQVLCFSCNAGKYINGGVCPHQDQVAA